MRVSWKVLNLNVKMALLVFATVLQLYKPWKVPLIISTRWKLSCCVTTVCVTVFVKVRKLDYRTAIKFLHLKDNAPTEIKTELKTVCRDSVPSSAGFKRGCTSVVDDERSGRPAPITLTKSMCSAYFVKIMLPSTHVALVWPLRACQSRRGGFEGRELYSKSITS